MRLQSQDGMIRSGIEVMGFTKSPLSNTRISIVDEELKVMAAIGKAESIC